ncbi:5-epiaristolochene synthase-like [Cucurbita maxima]|uniref:5-epiaristolochene synthase-like n=1 Tax=Cucurbita maxima TaxID=3661 RepID=A0A6J1KVE0_CUCMA|nr:5-epiaristolochene synthase-like [Cucurbita maxima]
MMGCPSSICKLSTKCLGDYFISYDSNTMENQLEEKMVEKQLQKLKEDVMNMFVTADKCSEKLRWWKQLNLIEIPSFARDRAVESYFWALGVYYEPNYSVGRMILAKIIALIAILDDMYDVYATLDELYLFTDAIQRWDINCVEKLPEYMKMFYEVILRTY